ncbi:MAG: hypothetical protein ACNYPE_03920 [Candidatus Azotimanducaceae bacterium WSBS_2022_MAG_OTU7]
MPAPGKLSLPAEDKKRLAQNLKRGKTPVQLVERSKIVWLAAQNMSNYQIADKLDIDVNKVVWINTPRRRSCYSKRRISP